MQKHSWIIGVLEDLEAYAKENDLPHLKQELAKTKVIARAEISNKALWVRSFGFQSVGRTIGPPKSGVTRP